jgi:hypothetical protein
LVAARSARGIEYNYNELEPTVPRIGDDFLGAAIYLYRNRGDAENSSYLGGSGFLVGYVDMHTTVMHIYAATNAHVIRDGFTVIRINKRFGDPDILELTPAAWTPHPDGDDLSICPLILTPQYDFKFVMTDGCVDEQRIKRFNIGVGDDVFMVGRFTGHSGKSKNLPIARFGNIAMVPSEEIENALGKKRPHYLVEVRSVSGFSGSPVFVYDAPIPPSLQHVRPEQFPNFLLGIDCGHMPEHEERLSAGIAAVVPAWRLLELLEHPRIKQLREEREAEIKEAVGKQETLARDTAATAAKQDVR